MPANHVGLGSRDRLLHSWAEVLRERLERAEEDSARYGCKCAVPEDERGGGQHSQAAVAKVLIEKLLIDRKRPPPPPTTGHGPQSQAGVSRSGRHALGSSAGGQQLRAALRLQAAQCLVDSSHCRLAPPSSSLAMRLLAQAAGVGQEREREDGGFRYRVADGDRLELTAEGQAVLGRQ